MPFVNIDPVPGTGLDFTHAAEFHSHFQKAKQQMQDVQWNVMQHKIVNLIQKSCSQGRTAWLRRRRGSGVETQTRERRATIFLSFTNSYYAGTQDPLSSLWGQTSSRRSGGYTGVPESLQSSRGKELKPISFSLPLEETERRGVTNSPKLLPKSSHRRRPPLTWAPSSFSLWSRLYSSGISAAGWQNGSKSLGRQSSHEYLQR